MIRLAVTPGDPAGIGPEVVWKSLCTEDYEARGIQLICFGARGPFDALGAEVFEVELADLYHRRYPALAPGKARVILARAPEKLPTKGKHLGGFQSGWAISAATGEILAGRLAGLVTGPISKENLIRGGFNYPGHTEMLAKLSRTKKVTMMLANDFLRVSLVTIHVPLKKVPHLINGTEVSRTVDQTIETLLKGFRISKPKIAVCGLNPHAGENGVLGTEEKKVIEPALKKLRKKWGSRAEIFGPLPADTLFAKHHMAKKEDKYDAVICMYHDQGLSPVKLLDFPRTVNVTLGLPFVRTSVDHGTGFDIAGKNLADPSSFRSAVELSLRLIGKNRGIENGQVSV
ncbi:MAG: 4-hydroxythreonine-4-phosphate dehydrogenase PdxA [Bdellovibrionales bacterium]|nr:4-hydroxythreonine-4-phosphate dehydrogenase PdxA [Bdellovibrionales bacterium]